jgi:hypothetical protein
MPSDSFLDNRISEELPYGNAAGKTFFSAVLSRGIDSSNEKEI